MKLGKVSLFTASLSVSLVFVLLFTGCVSTQTVQEPTPSPSTTPIKIQAPPAPAETSAPPPAITTRPRPEKTTPPRDEKELEELFKAMPFIEHAVYYSDLIITGKITDRRYEVVNVGEGEEAGRLAYTIFTLKVDEVVNNPPASWESS
jgi:hypothetical protein